MLKKMTTVLLVLGFIFTSLFFTASCAKKHIRQDTAVSPGGGAPARGMPSREIERGSAPAAKEEVGRQVVGAADEKLRMEIQAFQSQHIYFDFDRSELKPESRANLTKKAAWLKENPDFFVQIEGHCDERGTNEYNIALGERRADAAWKFLNAMGVSGNRMKTVSYGEEKPADPGHNESAWSRNRRDEFKLIRR